MSTLDSVLNPGLSAEVDPTFRAARVSIRPLEYALQNGTRILGHYKVFGQSTAAAPTANTVIGNFRYGDANSFAVILRAYTCVSVITAVTAQATPPMLLNIVRAYTASETTNTASIAPSGGGGNGNKLRTIMGVSTIVASGQIAVASAAAGLTGGTKNIDAVPVGAFPITSLVAIGSGMAVADLYKWDKVGEHPIVLAQNEGLVLQWSATTLATGTIQVGWGVDWAEVPAF